MSPETGHILSVDIGGATCKMGHVSADGDVRDAQRFATSSIRSGGPERLLEHLKPYVQENPIEGVAMGIPATVDWDHNNVRSKCEEVPWLEDASNKKMIQDGLKRPVKLVNDVEALLVGEWRWGELKGFHNGVVLSLGESMGSALLWDETPQQGRRGSIMELEHVSLDTHGEGSPPGSASYWLSGKGLKARLEQAGLDTDLQAFFRADGKEYNQLQQQFEDKLSHLLGLIMMMLDPERLVLTGGLTGSADCWLEAVEDKMDRYVMEQFQGLPSLLLGRLREDDVLQGPAAFWHWKENE